MGSDLRKVLKALEEQGFTVNRTASGHHEVRLDGRRVATLSGTGSDHRGLRNGIAYLRRAGFIWPPRKK